MGLSTSSFAWYLAVATLAAASPVFTVVAYIRPQLRRPGLGNADRALLLYLGSRCVAFLLLVVVAYWWRCPAYLVAITAGIAVTQLIDAVIHRRYGDRRLLGPTLAYVGLLAACTAMLLLSLSAV
ncbi:hypothetical protein [Microbacterium sp. E-13]|uniref:hypothetical protein n=1 Tax=Microbacterium sp. E-13 TaxID=3404048 RepID=UPI003CF0EA86